jgi:hypothetical protein
VAIEGKGKGNWGNLGIGAIKGLSNYGNEGIEMEMLNFRAYLRTILNFRMR